MIQDSKCICIYICVCVCVCKSWGASYIQIFTGFLHACMVSKCCDIGARVDICGVVWLNPALWHDPQNPQN